MRARVANPAEQARPAAAGRERIARWLESEATFPPLRDSIRREVARERGR